MFCKYCGKPVSDDAKFCWKCGGKLNLPEQAVAPIQEVTPVQAATPAKEETKVEVKPSSTIGKNSNVPICLAFSAVLQLGIIILSFFDLCNINVYSKRIGISVLDVFNSTEIVGYINSDATEILENYGITFIIAIGAFIIYFMYTLTMFLDYVSDKEQKIKYFSIIPDLILICVLTTIPIFISNQFGDYIDISLSIG